MAVSSAWNFLAAFVHSPLKNKRRKREVNHATTLAFTEVFAVFPVLSMGNTSHSSWHWTAVGGQCPVLNGAHYVTLSDAECAHTSYELQRMHYGSQVGVGSNLLSQVIMSFRHKICSFLVALNQKIFICSCLRKAKLRQWTILLKQHYYSTLLLKHALLNSISSLQAWVSEWHLPLSHGSVCKIPLLLLVLCRWAGFSVKCRAAAGLPGLCALNS